MNIQEFKTLHQVSQLERTQLLPRLAITVQSSELAGYLLTGNQSNFLYVENSTASSNDCPQVLPLLCEADKGFDCIPKYYR